MDLAEFIAARLDDDDAAALADVNAAFDAWWPGHAVRHNSRSPVAAREAFTAGWNAAHIARHDPARALREVAAKRAILADHPHVPRQYSYGFGKEDFGCQNCHDDDGLTDGFGWCETIRAVAAVWSDHPGYRDEWKP